MLSNIIVIILALGVIAYAIISHHRHLHKIRVEEFTKTLKKYKSQQRELGDY